MKYYLAIYQSSLDNKLFAAQLFKIKKFDPSSKPDLTRYLHMFNKFNNKDIYLVNELLSEYNPDKKDLSHSYFLNLKNKYDKEFIKSFPNDDIAKLWFEINYN